MHPVLWLVLFLLPHRAVADACVFDNSTVRCLRNGIRMTDPTIPLNVDGSQTGTARVLTGSDDPTTVPKFAERGSIYLRSSTGGHSTYQKQDNGTTSNWSFFGVGGSGGGGGEVNTASNVGTGSQVFKQKVGVDLQFRSFLGGGSTVVAQGADEITITSPATENVTGANTGSGIGLFIDKVASVLRFKTIEAGTNVTLTESDNTVTINSSGGATTTASNVGAGAGVYKETVGSDLRLRSIRAGQSTSVVENTDDITIGTDPVIGERNTIRNRGGGIGLSIDKIGAEHQLATVTGSGSTFASFANSTVTLSSAASEIATMRNVGGQAGVYKSKLGAEFGLKGLTAGSNITVTEGDNEITIASAGGGGGEVNTASNVGTGLGPFKQKVGVDLQFFGLSAGNSTVVEQNGNDVRYRTSISIPPDISVRNRGAGAGLSLPSPNRDIINLATISAGGSTSIALANSTVTLTTPVSEVASARNVGGTAGIFKSKVGAEFGLKGLTAGPNVTLTESDTDISISSTSSGPSGSGTDERLVRWDGTTNLQDSTAALTNAGALSGLTQLVVDDLILDGATIASSAPNSLTLDSSAGASANIILTPGSSGQVVIPAQGTASMVSASVTFSGDGNSGIYHLGDDNYGLSSAGGTKLEISSSALVANEGGLNYDFRVEGDSDANALAVDASVDSVGVGTASPQAKLHVVTTTLGSIPVPVSTTAQIAAIASPDDATQVYDTDKSINNIFDSQRFRNIAAMGWQPFAFPPNHVADAAFTTALTLAANGGSFAVPIVLSGHMLLQSVSVRNTDTGTERTWGWDLYAQYLNNGNSGENTLTRVSTGSANETFTPFGGLASTRTINADSAPIYLGPGTYWLVVQCRHATNNFGLGSTATSAAFRQNTAQTKTTTNPNGATLDFVAATWSKITDIYAVRLNGRVFGQTTSF